MTSALLKSYVTDPLAERLICDFFYYHFMQAAPQSGEIGKLAVVVKDGGGTTAVKIGYGLLVLALGMMVRIVMGPTDDMSASDWENQVMFLSSVFIFGIVGGLFSISGGIVIGGLDEGTRPANLRSAMVVAGIFILALMFSTLISSFFSIY